MRNDFCAVILTHGRPDRVPTYATARCCGYTGPMFLVLDNEDETADDYRKKYGKDNVWIFDKAKVAEDMDVGDNFPGRRGVVYARNAAFDLVREAGYRYFIQLDDDYTSFHHRFDPAKRYLKSCPVRNLDAILEGMVEYMESTPFRAIALSQGGDWIGGGAGKTTIGYSRKVMNTWVCDVEKPIQFAGRLNEDITASTRWQRKGEPFLTFMAAQVNQVATQAAIGGMSDLYNASGTYVKSFYTVMYMPSAAIVSWFRGTKRSDDPNAPEPGARIHHHIKWSKCAPMIVPERFRKKR